jgi:AraC family ethanolamine operon transcriptional activator
MAAVLRRSFDDLDEFGSALRGWSVEIRKLDRGGFESSVLQLDLGEARVLHLQVRGLVEAAGVAAPGFRSFGLPTEASSPARWCGREVGGRTLNIYDESGSFEALVRPGFESFVVSLSEDLLRQRNELSEVSSRAADQPASIEHDPTTLAPLRRMLETATHWTAIHPRAVDHAAFSEWMRFDLTGRLIELLARGRSSPPRLVPRQRDRILVRARDWIAQAQPDAYSVADLCRATGAGERTLRRAFLEHYGVSPRDYLKAWRLSGVRRALREADPTEVRVSDVANHWGFWHLGQFAADYRRVFGELPSATLARVR